MDNSKPHASTVRSRPLGNSMATVVASWLFVFVVAVSPAAGAPRESTWTRLDTAHFTVYSGAGSEVARDLGTDLELLHSVLAQLAGDSVPSPLPTHVYVFSGDEELQPFKPQFVSGTRGSGKAVAGGFFAARQLGNYVAINAGSMRSATEVIQHEYLHYFAENNLPRLPFWFSEGLAEYYSTFVVRGTVAVVGLPAQRSLSRLMRSRDLHLTARDLEALQGTTSTKRLFDDAHGAALAYSQSWAVVHYLLSSDLLALRTLDFMRQLDRGEEQEQAFESAFGSALPELSHSLQEYFRRGDLPSFRADVPDVSIGTAYALSPAARDAALGDLALQVGQRRLARSLLQGALQASASEADTRDPTLTRGPRGAVASSALASLAQLELAEGDVERAVFLAGDAVRAQPDAWLPLFVEGQSRLALHEELRLSARTADDTKAWQEQLLSGRRAFRRSLELEHQLGVGLIALGQSWLRAPDVETLPTQDLHEATESLERALTLLPKREDAAVSLAVLYAIAGDLERSATTLERERARFAGGKAPTAVWQHIAQLEFQRLDRDMSGALRELHEEVDSVGEPPGSPRTLGGPETLPEAVLGWRQRLDTLESLLMREDSLWGFRSELDQLQETYWELEAHI